MAARRGRPGASACLAQRPIRARTHAPFACCGADNAAGHPCGRRGESTWTCLLQVGVRPGTSRAAVLPSPATHQLPPPPTPPSRAPAIHALTPSPQPVSLARVSPCTSRQQQPPLPVTRNPTPTPPLPLTPTPNPSALRPQLGRSRTISARPGTTALRPLLQTLALTLGPSPVPNPNPTLALIRTRRARAGSSVGKGLGKGEGVWTT